MILRSMRKRDWAVYLVCALLACLAWADELVICRKCGHEGGEEAQFCAHCGAPFGETGTGTGDESVVGPSGSADEIIDFIESDLVEKDLKKASAYASRARVWRALFYAENAMALNLCAKPNESRHARVMKMVKSCRARLARSGGGSKCSACEGTGRVASPLVVESLRGGTIEHEGMGLTCKVCHGSGQVPTRSSLEKQKKGFGTARRQYAEARQNAGWIPLGDVWIPSDLEEKLSYRHMATMMRALSGRCEDCLGFGATTCEVCRGARKIPCKDCKTGLNVKMAEGFDGEKDLKMSVRCKTCRGNGWLKCADCRGRGTVPCESCAGIGRTEFCEKCHGRGLSKCDACSGKGKSDGKPCGECRGCGLLLCSSCDGSCRS